MGRHIRDRQSGNLFFALFGAVALVAVLGTTISTLVKGPVRSMHAVTQNTRVTNDLIAAGALLSEHTLSLPDADADCDGDGIIEPPPWKPAPVGAAPTGGGVLPDTVGVNRRDPWGNDYGYCVWDHGSKTVSDNVAACGGASAHRRRGGPSSSGIAIALVSSGPDRIFQTSCADYIDDDHPGVIRPAGSDDIVRVLPYGQFLLPRVSSARLEDLADAACTVETIGIMRLSLGVVQACMDTGWEEVGTAAQATGNFDPIINAGLATHHTSNSISFAGFMGTKNIEVQGDAALLVNGIVTPSPTQIVAGDDVALRATSSSTPETTLSFSVSISGVKKTWTLRTRDRTPANLEITPPAASNMLVDGESGTAYSGTTTFTVRNMGEDKAVLYSPAINSSDFEVTANSCAAASLLLNDSCSVTVRAKATATGALAGTLTVSGAAEYYGGNVSKTASLSGDALFPVTLTSATAVNLAALPDFTANGRWAASRPKRVIVPAGTIIGSTAPGVPALRTGTGRGGTLHITVNGEIQGAGGQPNSGAGGTALLVEQAGLTLVNNGAIRAGGGAGGQGGNG
ncbi:MAG TPA: hypothetical protein VNS12_11635, partial [Pelagibacterium sp.]|uniref:hypothetical protein n=1 Tax=Pelagibacterium sp. TaxID=1967288 RepID=UPI002B58FDBA